MQEVMTPASSLLGIFILSYISIACCCSMDIPGMENSTSFLVSNETVIGKNLQVSLLQVSCMQKNFCFSRKYTAQVAIPQVQPYIWKEQKCSLEFPIMMENLKIEKTDYNVSKKPIILNQEAPEIMIKRLQSLFIFATLDKTIIAGMWKVDSKCWMKNRSLINCGRNYLLRKELMEQPTDALHLEHWILKPITSLRGTMKRFHLHFDPNFFFPGVQTLLDQCCYKEIHLDGTGWGNITITNQTSLKSLFVKHTTRKDLKVRLDTMPQIISLSLPETTMGNLPYGLKYLTQLEELDVSSNNLTYLPSYLLTSSNLKVLNVSNNGLRALPFTIDQLTHLRVLNVSRNKITAQNLSEIAKIEELEVLDLSYNAIQNITKELSGLKKLKYLDLNYNDDLQVFSFMNQSDIFPSLKVLKLSNTGYVMNNGKDILENVNGLEYIDISGNVRFSWADKPFKFLIGKENLTFLNMSGIDMNRTGCLGSSLPEDYGKLEPLINLTVLDLSHCNLQNLSENTFQNFPKLEHLDLSNNKLEYVPDNLAVTLRNIKKINLEKNIIRLIHLKMPPEITVETIDLSHNHITSPVKIIYSGRVRFLDLSFNYISSWNDSNAFSNWVQHVDLSDNRIDFPTEIMRKSFRSLKRVDLGENPVDCRQCKTKDLQRWLGKNIPENIWNLSCAWPLSDKGKNLRTVKLSPNLCNSLKRDKALMITMCVLSVTILATVGIVYKYRLQIAYMLHVFGMKRRYKEKYDNDEKEFDAFICYSGLDSSWVINELSPHLESGPENYKLCIHERDFPVGTFIMRNIDKAIKSSRHTIVVLSNKFLNSSWCRWELELTNYTMIHEDRDLIIMIELEPLDHRKIPSFLKFLMNTRTYLEWPKKHPELGSTEQAWKRLRAALGESLYQQKGENNISDTTV